jgi:Bacterial dnaA protein helix-turn-helix
MDMCDRSDTPTPGAQLKRENARRRRLLYCRLVQLTVEQTIERTLGVPTERLRVPKRGQQGVVFARHVAMYLAQIEGQLTLTETGRIFGRDRRGVAYALGQLEQKREDDPWFDVTLDHLEHVVRTGLAHATRYAEFTGQVM